MDDMQESNDAAGSVAPMRWRTLLACVLLAACSSDDRAARRRSAGPSPDLVALLRVANTDSGERLFGRCAACHAIRRGATDRNGPTLYGVMDAPVAQVSKRFGYTAALQRVGGHWTPARMDAWLADPQHFAPGTSMGFAGLADPLDRADVIAYLQAQH